MTLLLKVTTVATVVFSIGSGIYAFRVTAEKQAIQAAMLKQERQGIDAQAALKLRLEQGEKLNHDTIQKAQDTLSQAQQDYSVAMAKQHAQYAIRLRSSEARNGVYNQQANAGPVECQHLASHAARLDFSLEEGRGLVRELADTVRFRDEQIKALAVQITADRLLVEELGK